MKRSMIWFLLAWWNNAVANGQDGVFHQTRFLASGRHETRLNIGEMGRYSIRVASPQGVALELVDRMAGTLARDGVAGSEDGRIDTLLEPGEYKVRIEGPDQAKGDAALSVFPFRELETQIGTLKPHALISTELRDLEQRSYWVVLPQDGTLRLEAIGRDLAGCKLWYPGGWVVAAEPSVTVYEPSAGQPMTHVELHHRLGAGTYLLTCYGGVPLSWARETGAHPLHLRLGVPDWGGAGIHSVTVSPFGRESFLVSGNANYFQLARDQKSATRMSLSRHIEEVPRFLQGRDAVIDKNSREPICELNASTGTARQWLTVQAQPGDRVSVRHFQKQQRIRFRGNQDYWISTVHGHQGEDALEVSAVLSRLDRENPQAQATVSLSPGNPLVRRTNLLGALQLFLKVETEGVYTLRELKESTAQGAYRIEPFWVRRPDNYSTPPAQMSGASWPLTPGIHLLTVNPVRQGILAFQLSAENDAGPETTPDSVRQSVIWPKVALSGGVTYELWVADRFGIATGIVLRTLPLDLREPLPLSLMPGEVVPISAKLETTSILTVDGGPYELSSATGILDGAEILPPGNYRFLFRNTGNRTASYTLHAAEPGREYEVSQPPGDFSLRVPTLSPGDPLFLNYQRGIPQFFLWHVEEAGLYRLETTGRLATALFVRTRTNPDLFSGNANGVGRNGLVQQFFSKGTFLVSAQTTGESQGRAGISVRGAALRMGPPLEEGIVQKVGLGPDAAVKYPIKIEEPGDYRIHTLGLGKTFAHRLEDGDGWPVGTPGLREPVQTWLDHGAYTYFSLPEPVESRRLTLLERVEEPKKWSGKGPQQISFNREVDQLWRSGEPDRFTLHVPAPVTAKVTLTRGMSLAVTRSGSPVFEVLGGVAWQGDLAAGDYAIAVRRLEDDDRFPYRFRIATADLIPGVAQRRGQWPAEVGVSVASASLTDIHSFGPTDVKARLLDEAGNVLAQNDDAEDDWNFHFSLHLTPGKYRLALSGVGENYGPVEVSLSQRPVKAGESGVLPFSRSLVLDGAVGRIPLATTREGLYRFGIAGPGQPWMALFREDRLLAETGKSMTIPLPGDARYSLMVWNKRPAAGEMTVQAASLDIEHLEIAGTISRMKPETAYFCKDPAHLAYRAEGDGAEAWFSPEQEVPLTEVPLTAAAGRTINLFRGSGWLLTGAVPLSLSGLTLQEQRPLGLILTDPLVRLSLDQAKDSPILVTAETTKDAVGMSAIPASAAKAVEYPWPAVWLGEGRSMTVIPGPGNYHLTVWQTGGEVARERVLLTAREYPREREAGLSLGETQEGSLPSGRSLRLKLDHQPQRVGLLLTQGLVAAIDDGMKTLAIAASPEQSEASFLPADGGWLTLINTGNSIALFRVSAQSPGPFDRPVVLDAELGFERIFHDSGTLRIDIPPFQAPAMVYVAGEDVRGDFLTEDGRRIPIENQGQGVAGPGSLSLSHGKGYLRVWRAESNEREARFLGEAEAHDVADLAEGRQDLAPEQQWWKFKLAEPCLVRLVADAPGITAVLRNGEVMARSAGTDPKHRELVHFLAEGSYQVGTRPFRGTEASGTLDFHKIVPDPLTEGDQRQRLIRDRELQAFLFEVSVAGTVGVGVAPSGDRLESRLFDRDYRSIASGPYFLGKLAKGEYLLVVEGRERPVTYKPVVLGLNGPVETLPDEVVARFRDLVAGQ